MTSRCATAWVPPDSGTLAGTPTFLIAALISASTQKTSCSQASQTMTDRIWMMLRMLSWWVSRPSVGLAVRDGQAEHGDQGDRHAHGQHGEGQDGQDSGRDVAGRTGGPTVTGRLRPGIGGAISTDLPE